MLDKQNKHTDSFIEPINSVENIDIEKYGYTIFKQGSLQYIVNINDQVVSNGYHSFDQIKYDNDLLFLAKKGSKTVILKKPKQIDDFMEESVGFHGIEYREDLKKFVVSTGSIEHILDLESGTILDGRGKFSQNEIIKSKRVLQTVEELCADNNTSEKESRLTEKRKYQRENGGYHHIKFDPSIGLVTGKTGATKRIIDPGTAEPLSKKYHDIFFENGILYGKIGTRKEKITLPEQLLIDSQTFLGIPQTEFQEENIKTKGLINKIIKYLSI